ncbi:MAG: hypothetical protein Q9209_002561 [Squamulea sp. 1 TL-2023]
MAGFRKLIRKLLCGCKAASKEEAAPPCRPVMTAPTDNVVTRPAHLTSLSVHDGVAEPEQPRPMTSPSPSEALERVDKASKSLRLATSAADLEDTHLGMQELIAKMHNAVKDLRHCEALLNGVESGRPMPEVTPEIIRIANSMKAGTYVLGAGPPPIKSRFFWSPQN